MAAVMAVGEWVEIAIRSGIALAGGVAGAFLGVWKWGHSSATAKQAIKNQITASREEVRKEMAAHVQKIEDGHDELISHFEESFNGIRRQHDEHKLDVEKRFMLKDDFRDFREEYRQDQARTDAKLDRLLGMKL
jgi:hypothetical protein